MVREKRRRYVIVEVSGQMSERELVDYLKGFKGEGGLWLIYYDGKNAVVRTNHKAKEKAVDYLNGRLTLGGGSRRVMISTRGVTGTIKRARMKYLGGITIPRRSRKPPAGGRRRRGQRRR